jgi:peptidoglycan/xylan/chitin deacetylase (PgdA/CDA1 family)
MTVGVPKRLFALGVACGLFAFDEVRSICRRLIGRKTPGICVALTYHSVLAERRQDFARQMDIVQRMATPLRGDSRSSLAESRRHVVLTFDDGLASFAQNALPELEERHFPAVVFVVSDRLGATPDWRNYTPGQMPTERALTADELRGVSRRALVGSHSATHPMLTNVDRGKAIHEIEASRQQLEAMLGQRIRLFCFPYGAFSPDLIAVCRAAGYERVFTSDPVLALSDPAEFVTGRFDVRPDDWPVEFRLKVAGAYRWLPYAIATKRALLRILSRQHAEESAPCRERLQ